MKKILTVLLLIGSSLSYGDELKFVTYLSSPVGTFSQLETADPSAPLVMTGASQEVNFCNTRVPSGSINVQGASGAAVKLAHLNLSAGTSLKGDISDYRLSNSLTLNSGGSLTAQRILGTAAAYDSGSMHKSKVNNTLYLANAGTVKGAKTGSLTISNKVETGANGEGTTGAELWWDNQYTRDYTSGGEATGSTYTSYLLKSKKAVEETTDDCSAKFVVNDTCCEWEWNQWKKGADAPHFDQCWKKAVYNVWQITEVWALNNVCYSSSCSCYGDVSYCSDTSASSGECTPSASTSTPCNIYVVERCKYMTASEAAAVHASGMEGYYNKVRQKQCVANLTDCRDASHMVFPEPSTPVCYVRK